MLECENSLCLNQLVYTQAVRTGMLYLIVLGGI